MREGREDTLDPEVIQTQSDGESDGKREMREWKLGKALTELSRTDGPDSVSLMRRSSRRRVGKSRRKPREWVDSTVITREVRVSRDWLRMKVSAISWVFRRSRWRCRRDGGDDRLELNQRVFSIPDHLRPGEASLRRVLRAGVGQGLIPAISSSSRFDGQPTNAVSTRRDHTSGCGESMSKLSADRKSVV